MKKEAKKLSLRIIDLHSGFVTVVEEQLVH